ncbi:MAG: type II toxin-antitoxin system VapC family toxin [Gammaproteobacteria bacterium]|nr:type II toxin-antitoxin system VapC family toxin [Gammaproteobacteria bacterium]
MILVDTSVWIDLLRVGEEYLAALLNDDWALSHPFVVGELACGNLHNRSEVLTLLSGLPQASMATDAEVLFFIEQHRLMGRGIGYIDAHLLAAALLDKPTQLWTRDKRLKEVAVSLQLAYEPS